MSETPKKIEFIMMKDSAAELVIANSVAFMDSEESCKKFQRSTNGALYTYDALLFDNID